MYISVENLYVLIGMFGNVWGSNLLISPPLVNSRLL